MDGALEIDGELVRDLDQATPPASRWHFVGR
ncbi:hypothetical protein EV378_5069 [Pseudonocardia endophytica]|uniref:Uncharacterized protein n=1 Tax=Pseudonocardia endophytica TaxID=401976 RepID=A0A4R1HG14_PSEEN|nr:hypothetical protein EV378_5069 [Pseudonocardia endophytica]